MRTSLSLLLVLTVSINFFGQTGFYENLVAGESYTTVRPQLVKAADVDGDSDLDVITYGTELNWYRNIDGLGNFGERKTITTPNNGATGSSLYLIDFDNDGDMDIMSSVINQITLHKNTNGLGNFQVLQVFTLGAAELHAVPTDMDGDGDLDIVCNYVISGGPFQAKIVWFENNGGGAFAPEQVITTNALTLNGISHLITDDLDGDNDPDIILGYRSAGKIAWLKHTDGNGTFSAAVTITTLVSGMMSVLTADFDNDGDKDILSGGATTNPVAWYKNLDGLGNFSTQNVITTNTSVNVTLVTNINNGNTIDLVYNTSNEIGWMSNTDGLGNFGSPQLINNKSYDIRSVIIADLDGDGKRDLISASEDDDKVAWYKNLDGNGNFGRQAVIARSIDMPMNVYSGDFDEDNDIDLLVNSKLDGKLSWFENVNGLGFYGKQHVITESLAEGFVIPIAYPADIDGDGDLDIACMKDALLFWYENVDGHGNFTLEHTIDTNSLATIIRADDLDGDGDMDLVCGVYNANMVSWYQNLDGNGTFGPEQIIDEGGTNGSLTSIEIANMDGDNDKDIIASSAITDTYYYKNTNGLGNFVYQHMSVFNRLYAVYPADMDGDGDKDIIGVSAQGGGVFDAVIWYENSNGLGNFTVEHPISTLTVYGRSIHAADLDNDGDMDVLTSGGHVQTSGQLAWYQNNGSGVFTARQMIQERFDLTIGMCVTTADIDSDNDKDVVAIFAQEGITLKGRVSVFENLGPLGNIIQGTVRADLDLNGCTNTDPTVSNLMIISGNASQSFATFTDQNGTYQLVLPQGNFTTSITPQLPNFFTAAPASYSAVFNGVNNTQTADFCLTPLGAANDLDISVYPSVNDLRMAQTTYYRVVYRNIGITTLNGSVNFQYNNNKLSFVNANDTVSSQTANTLTFSYTNLQPFQTRTIDLQFIVLPPPATNTGDSIATIVTVNPVLGDATTANNTHVLNQLVVGSYDPNDIRCLEGNQVLIGDANEYLHYVIRFQNTGNANAINVKVENTLDNKLDWTTMQLESLSHPGRVELTDGSDVRFIFENINLPDSNTNEPHSHGFIAYKIKPMNNVVVGDIVYNTADIYFDFNPAVTTNTFTTQFVNVLSNSEVAADTFNIYPNPINSIVNIEGNHPIDTVTIIDLHGRLLKEYRFETPTLVTQCDMSDFTQGVYILKIKSNQGSTTKKIIKR